MEKRAIIERISRTLGGSVRIPCTFNGLFAEIEGTEPQLNEWSLLKNGTVIKGKLAPAGSKDVQFTEVDLAYLSLAGNGHQILNINSPLEATRVNFYRYMPTATTDVENVRSAQKEQTPPTQDRNNPNAVGTPQFLVHIPHKEATERMKNSREELQLKLIISNLSAKDQYNLAFAMGLRPYQVSIEETWDSLDKMASVKHSGEHPMMSFLKNKQGIEMEVVLAKALAYSIVNKEGGVYMFHTEPCGTDKAQIKNHFTIHSHLYEGLKAEVLNKDIIPFELRSALNMDFKSLNLDMEDLASIDVPEYLIDEVKTEVVEVDKSGHVIESDYSEPAVRRGGRPKKY